jgi:hypothetical protein
MRCIVALLLLSELLAAQTPKPEQRGTIHGVVKDTTGAPVGGLRVSARRSPGSGVPITAIARPANAVTDGTGTYAFADLAPGTYSLRTPRDPATKVVKLDAGQQVAVEFVIPANSIISGRVFDPNKRPIPECVVWLLKPEYQDGVLRQTVIGPRVTDDDGDYSFDSDLEVNRRYYLLVDRPPAAEPLNRDPTEVPTYYPAATRIDDATTVILQPGEIREHVDIKIATAPLYCVDGKIQSAGKPTRVDFAVFETPLAGTRLARVRNRSSEDGKYYFCGLPPGAYRLSTEQGFTEFIVAGSDVQHVDLTLDPADVRLQVDWDSPPISREFPKLDAQAEETLHKIAAAMGMGDNPSADGLEELAMRLRQPLGNDPERREALTKLQSPDFNMEMGNLLAQLPLLASYVGVSLAGISNPYFGPVRDGLPAGEYRVNVSFPPDSYVKHITFNDIDLSGGVLHLAPAASGTLQILLAQGAAELAVAVADSEDKPVPNATVIVVPESVTSVPALSRTHTLGHTDQNGNFTVKSLAPGRYRVLATPQTVRWEVPEDLGKVLLVMFQAKDVELDVKASAQIGLAPIPIY